MIALIGLGNPEEIHSKNRHNIGFMAIDKISKTYNLGPFKSKFKSKFINSSLNNIPIILLKPQTYMNLSGSSVNEIVKFYKIKPEDIIVIHDDLDINLGKIKTKIGGGNSGHNGLKNIDSYIGNNYRRIRIGIGHPGNKELVNKFVLSNFNKDEIKIVELLLNDISKNIAELIDSNNISKTINADFDNDGKE